VIPRSFEYFDPSSVEETLELLHKHGSDAKVLAGGQSLIPIMKLRLASPSYIVDLNRIPGLDYILEDRGKMLIGALVRHRQIVNSELIKKKIPIMTETAELIGDSQVRNLGTLVGSLVHCDPGGDWGSTMIALRATIKVAGQNGARVIKIDDFFEGTFQSAIGSDELVTEVEVPIPKEREGGAYMKFERKAGDFASVGVACQLSFDRSGICTYAGIGLTAAAPTNIRAKKAEDALLGKKISGDDSSRAAKEASEIATPVSDPIRGSAEYKKAMVELFTRRAIDIAATRGQWRE
jgi:aerobic carbon-monoxide dehydrogenase medium subunit